MPFGTIARWISGDDPNKRARAAERDEQKRRDKEATRIHEHNMEVHEATIENYSAERDYAFETATTNWEYSKRLQDFSYAKDLNAYTRSEQVYGATTNFNKIGETLAINDEAAAIQDLELKHAFQREAMHTDLISEIKKGGIKKLESGVKLASIQSNRRTGSGAIQQTLNEFTKQNTFDKEANFVKGLQESGKAALGQAGVSRTKTLQSTAANTFRSLVELDSTLSGARNKAGIDLLKLQVESSLSETQVGLNLDLIELGLEGAKEEVQFNNRILEADMTSALGQMERNIQQINLRKMGADLQAQANRNLFPEKFEYRPEPQITPERKFVAPLKQEAAKVQKGARVSTGIDSVFEVVAEVGDIVASVVGLGDVVEKIPGWNDIFNAGGKASKGTGVLASDVFNSTLT